MHIFTPLILSSEQTILKKEEFTASRKSSLTIMGNNKNILLS